MQHFSVRRGAMLVLSAVLLVGCDKGNGGGTAQPTTAPSKTASGENHNTSNVGVIDLARIGDQIGWANEIKRDIDASTLEYQRTFDSYQAQIASRVTAQKDRLAKAARLNADQTEKLNKNQDLDSLPFTKEQRQELNQSLYTAQLYAQNAANNIQQASQRRVNEIQLAYTQRSRPFIRKVAEERGISIILARTDNIFYFDSTVDLSDKVVDAIAQAKPTVTLPALQPVQLPEVNLGEAPKPVAASQPATQPTPVIPAATRPAAP